MKAIYKPKGKAGEYARWACNFFTGCSNDCSYCYCKKYPLSKVWTPFPKLKKAFKDENDAFRTFCREVEANADTIQADGSIFFSFSTDPCLPETLQLTLKCVEYASVMFGVPCQILTKCIDWANTPDAISLLSFKNSYAPISIGMTITGLDNMETNSPSNDERLRTLLDIRKRYSHPVFISAEPVVDFSSALPLLLRAIDGGVDLIKVGLMSGKDSYDTYETTLFANRLVLFAEKKGNTKLYFKDSIRKVMNGSYKFYDSKKVCVGADYSIFSK